MDEIVFPAVGGESDSGGVVAAGADTQDVAQGAESGLAEEVDEKSVADGFVGLKKRLGAAEHDEHVNGEIGARGFEGGKKGCEGECITDAREAHADDRTARRKWCKHEEKSVEYGIVIWQLVGWLASSGRCHPGRGL